MNPMDEALLGRLHSENCPLFTAEENALTGGFGAQTAALCVRRGWRAPGYLFALGDTFIPHGSRKELLRDQGLSGEHMAQVIEERIKR